MTLVTSHEMGFIAKRSFPIPVILSWCVYSTRKVEFRPVLVSMNIHYKTWISLYLLSLVEYPVKENVPFGGAKTVLLES